ncbi:MAG: hypothetical protein R3230_01580 [Nitrosopumilaceae archaeon]|nr:hypothetical protein [Nitrosopumilaceae archaeon]
MKHILALTALLSLGSLYTMEKENKRLAQLAIVHKNKEFMVHNGKELVAVHSYDIDKPLRSISSENLAKLLVSGARLEISKFDGIEEYSIKLSGGLKGGGPTGAAIGFWVGRIGTYAVFGTGIVIASALTGPAAPATFYTLANSLAPVAAATAEAAAVGCGIIGAVATGPV